MGPECRWIRVRIPYPYSWIYFEPVPVTFPSRESNIFFAVENRCLIFTYLSRLRSRTRPQFIWENTFPLRLRTTILKITRSTFRFRTLISNMNPFPLRTRTYNLETDPFALRFRLRTWIRERNGYGIITRTPDSGLIPFHIPSHLQSIRKLGTSCRVVRLALDPKGRL